MVVLPGKDSEKIFINCPFDEQYEPTLRAVIFGVQANGFNPVCAKEKTGGDTRLDKILSMIYDCGYGIHDISRVEIDTKTHYPRFNMAFELGLFIACRQFGTGDQQNKDYLILDTDSHNCTYSLSDIMCKDPMGHENNPELALHHVNDWLGQKRVYKSGKERDYIGSKTIRDYYQEFLIDFPILCKDGKADMNNVTHREYIYIAGKWLEKKKEMEDKKLVVTDTVTFTIGVKKN